jgi:hypothetical protein
MKRFLVSLAISILLLAGWFLTYLVAQYPVQPHLYMQVAPFWHIGLFVIWFSVQVYTGICAVYWFWNNQLQRHQLAQQPPNHAR